MAILRLKPHQQGVDFKVFVGCSKELVRYATKHTVAISKYSMHLSTSTLQKK